MFSISNTDLIHSSSTWAWAENYLDTFGKTCEIESFVNKKITLIEKPSGSRNLAITLLKVISYASLILPMIAWTVRNHYRHKFTITHRDLNAPENPNLIPVWILHQTKHKWRELPYVKIRFPRSEYRLIEQICEATGEKISGSEQVPGLEAYKGPKPIIAVIIRGGGGHTFGMEGKYDEQLGRFLETINATRRIYVVEETYLIPVSRGRGQIGGAFDFEYHTIDTATKATRDELPSFSDWMVRGALLNCDSHHCENRSNR